MNSDAYFFFTGCHRLYIQGIRRSLRERLELAFGEDWWEKGVAHAVTEDQLKGLQAESERSPDRERHLLLDVAHFGRIISKHHNVVFQDAFTDTLRTFKELRRLAVIRNDWAHIQDISWPRARQAAELMKHILASLRCEEALEVEQMSESLDIESVSESPEDLIDELEHQDSDLVSQDSTIEPWDFWRQLQSCLVVEKSVELLENDHRGPARVVIKVHNTAPDSRDLPAVHFKSVAIDVRAESVGSREERLGGRREEIGGMSPGDTREVEFAFPKMQLVDVEFEVFGEIDVDRLFRFGRATVLPDDVLAPLRQEFLHQLESIGVREFVSAALDTIGAPDPSMTLADIARTRESLKQHSEHIEEKIDALAQLFGDFHLSRGTALGGRTREIILALGEFRTKLNALDEAFGRTDLESMTEAVHDLKQVQLAVLRVEDTLRAMTTRL